MVGLSGYPPRRLGWKQFRALGAIALDLCAVAGGRLDAYVDCSPSAHGPWDYLGGLLVCREAGAWSSTPTARSSPPTTPPGARRWPRPRRSSSSRSRGPTGFAGEALGSGGPPNLSR